MRKQQGFTLIELVMVIMILGILAATAIPKFANLQKEARIASIEAAAGAMKSAMGIVHAQSLIKGQEMAADATVILEGTTIATSYGYPSKESIDEAAGLDSNDYSVSIEDNKVTIAIAGHDPDIGSCEVAYTEATDSNTPAKVATPLTSGC
jgi:MSHA pilin protein MshA